jgi:hypothetical protein
VLLCSTMALALFRSQVVEERLPSLTQGADRAAQLRAGGVDVPDVQLSGELQLGDGAFDMYGAPKSTAVAQARDEQVFAKDMAQAGRSSLRRQQQRNGLRRLSNCVVQLRRASVEHRTLLHHLGEFQARVEEKIDAQESRMTAAQKAGEILMAMGRAKGQQRKAEEEEGQVGRGLPMQHSRRHSVGNVEGDMRCATRQWGKLRVAAQHEGHDRLVQRDVAAVRQQVARWEQSHGGTAAGPGKWERRASFAIEELRRAAKEEARARGEAVSESEEDEGEEAGRGSAAAAATAAGRGRSLLSAGLGEPTIRRVGVKDKEPARGSG